LEFRKARERTPETRADFEDVTISLIDDQWLEEGGRRQPGKASGQELSVLAVFDELIGSTNVVTHKGRRAVHSDTWKDECLRRGFLVTPNAFRSYRSRLAGKYLIECGGDLAWKP
jgi:hypothetical protein